MMLNVSGGTIIIDPGNSANRAARINYVEISSASNPPPSGHAGSHD